MNKWAVPPCSCITRGIFHCQQQPWDVNCKTVCSPGHSAIWEREPQQHMLREQGMLINVEYATAKVQFKMNPVPWALHNTSFFVCIYKHVLSDRWVVDLRQRNVCDQNMYICRFIHVKSIFYCLFWKNRLNILEEAFYCDKFQQCNNNACCFISLFMQHACQDRYTQYSTHRFEPSCARQKSASHYTRFLKFKRIS